MIIQRLRKLLKFLTVGLLLVVFLKIYAGFSHPYHVSVTEIVQNEVTGTLEITIKTIPEDMFQILEERIKDTLFIGEDNENPESDSVLAEYLSETFILTVNGNPVKPILLGKELEPDVFWCYLETAQKTRIDSMALTCTLLVENIPSQANIVHFNIGGIIKTAHLNREIVNCVFNF